MTGLNHLANQTCDHVVWLNPTSDWILQPNLPQAYPGCVKVKKQPIQEESPPLIWALQILRMIWTTLLSRSCRRKKPRWRWGSQSWCVTNPRPTKSRPSLAKTTHTKRFIWCLNKIYRRLYLTTILTLKNNTQLLQNIRNTHAFHLDPVLTAIILSSLHCPCWKLKISRSCARLESMRKKVTSSRRISPFARPSWSSKSLQSTIKKWSNYSVRPSTFSSLSSKS